MNTLWTDLRYGARMLSANPGFTAVAALALALGIGANTAIFSVINTVLLKPLPYTESERLVAVWEVRKDGARGSVSYPNFVDWRAQNGVFERIAVYRESTMTLTGGGEPANLRVVITSPDLFPLLNARPQLGRGFLPEEEKAGSRIVVLGQGAWRKHFGADPNLVGRQINLDGRAFTVAGVMPGGFDFPVKAEQTDLWVSAAISSEQDSPGGESLNEQRGAHVYDAIARLKPGVTLAAAQADLETVMGRLRMQYPDEVGGDHAAMRPYLNDLVGDVEWALLVLFGAGLLINSFARLLRVNPGFDSHQVLTLRVDLPDAKYGKPEQVINFNRELLKRIQAVPGVRSAAMVFKLPLGGSDASTTFEVEDQPPDKSRRQSAGARVATPGYFRTLGIPFISGRDFTDRDELKSTPVVIINETLAQRYFPDQNPIGKHLRPDIAIDSGPPWREIVGVTRSVRHHGLSKEPRPEFYLPHAQMPDLSLTTVVRTAGNPLAIIGAVRNEVRAMDSELPVDRVKTLDQYLAYSVAQRTREIGVRVALGAQTGDVVRLILGQGMKLTLLGVAIGLVTALTLTRLMKSLLFGVSATDPLTFAVISLLLLIVALLAVLVPARRAMKVDPIVALRYEKGSGF